MLSYFLTRNGYAVVLAASGEEALEKLGAEDFDVALCDVMMPGIDGLEVLRRSKGLSRRTEIIMVTGQPTLEAEAEAARLGAFDYVAKPYSLDRIFHLLSRALLRSRAKKVKEDEHAGGE
ncbi:MAG: response regulator [Elusimicrobia bacterium]|nr:response regulator [Elusimicrobiota bacterium]